MSALMPLLDAARGHEGEYDDTSYALAHAVHQWINEKFDGDWRQKRLEDAYRRGTVRGYLNKETGEWYNVEYPPSAEAVIAELLSP